MHYELITLLLILRLDWDFESLQKSSSSSTIALRGVLGADTINMELVKTYQVFKAVITKITGCPHQNDRLRIEGHFASSDSEMVEVQGKEIMFILSVYRQSVHEIELYTQGMISNHLGQLP